MFVCRLKRTVKQLKEQVKQSTAAAEMYVCLVRLYVAAIPMGYPSPCSLEAIFGPLGTMHKLK